MNSDQKEMNILLSPYDYFPVCFQEEETALLSFTGEGLKSDNSVADVDLKYLKPFVFTPPPLAFSSQVLRIDGF